MSRKYYGSTKVNGLSPKTNDPLKITEVSYMTIGFELSKEQASDLINALIKALKDDQNNIINLTGFRKTNQLTVTSYISPKMGRRKVI